MFFVQHQGFWFQTKELKNIFWSKGGLQQTGLFYQPVFCKCQKLSFFCHFLGNFWLMFKKHYKNRYFSTFLKAKKMILTLRSNPFTTRVWPKKRQKSGRTICAPEMVFFFFFVSGRLVHDHLPPVLGPFGLRFVPERHFTLQISIFRDLGKLNVL